VIASGLVDAVYPERRRIRISHGPIDALAWPAMTMEFDVLGSTELSAIKVGQNIRFGLEQQLAGEYAIVNLGVDAGASSMESQVPDVPGQSGTAPQPVKTNEADKGAAQSPSGSGLIIEIGRTSRILKLKHQPIEALGWPAMTMNFDVAEDVDIDQLEKGQTIHFELSKGAGAAYVITSIEAVETAGGDQDPGVRGDHEGHDHD
jgi:Cu(I)/Ag(I) efflux system membrane fusion protein